MHGQRIHSDQVVTKIYEFREPTYAYLLRPVWHGKQDFCLLHDSLLAMAFTWEVEEQSLESFSDTACQNKV